MAGNTARRRDRRKGMDQPRARRRNWFREVSEKFHKRAMDITLLLFRGRAGIGFTLLEVLYFCVVFFLMRQRVVTSTTIFLFLVLNIGFVGFFICLLSRAVFSTLQQESRLTEAAIEETLHRADLDALSGLYNRTALYRELNARIRHAENNGAPLSLILFDLDDFKEVNDLYGHAVGDQTITRLSGLLRDRVRGSELAARYGGEEFVLVLPGTRLAGAASRANFSRERVEELTLPAGTSTFHLTVSAGVAEWQAGMDAAALIELADRRMYEAKEAGKNRVNSGDAQVQEALEQIPSPMENVLRRPPAKKTRRSFVEDPGSKQEFFLLLLQQCLYGIGLWLVLTIFLSHSVQAFLAYAGTGLSLFVLYSILRTTQNPKTVKWLYVAFAYGSMLLMLPAMYFFCGGLGSGVPVLFILAASAITLLFNGPFAVFTLTLLTLLSFAVMGLDLGHPGLVSRFTDLGDLSYFYTLATTVFVGVTLSRIMRMLYRNYQENRKFSDELMKQLQETSVIDPLSGAYDRRFLLDYLAESIQLTESGELPVFSVLMFDLDHFKLINDHYGHLTGDECIRSLARLVKENLRQDDVLIRYGGEEFVCVLRGASDYTAVKRAEEIRAKVSAASLAEALREPVTLSCGVVMYRPGMTPDELIREADRQLYRAKQKGRNRVSCRDSLPRATS